MILRSITQIDAEGIIEEFNLLDGSKLNNSKVAELRNRLNEVSSEVNRLHNLPNINLKVLEKLTKDCIKNFDDKKNIDIAEMENWFGVRLHNVLRLTRNEAAKNEIWFFMGLYFYNFILWRWQYSNERGNLENLLLGLPLAKLSRQIFSRCWWMAEVTRDGSSYSENAQINGDYTNQLLDVNMFQIPGFSYYINKFIISKNIEKNFRQKFRTFMYLTRELIVAQPMSSFSEEVVDPISYKKWLLQDLDEDYLIKNKNIYNSGPKDSIFGKDAEDSVLGWFEGVWKLSDIYYENIEENINLIIKEQENITIEEIIEKIKSENLLPRSEQEDIKNIFNEINKK